MYQTLHESYHGSTSPSSPSSPSSQPQPPPSSQPQPPHPQQQPPGHAHEIMPGLWLGNAKASLDDVFLQSNRIEAVVNCTKTHAFHPAVPIKIRVPVDDNLEDTEIEHLGRWSVEVVYKILEIWQRGRHAVFIHCAAGIQRSAACTAMVLIAYHGIYLNAPIHTSEAIQRIRAIRPIAFQPRINFAASIEGFNRYFHTVLLPAIQQRR